MDYTGYLIFLNNPNNWELDRFLEDNFNKKSIRLSWTIDISQIDKIKIGNYGIFRIGKDIRTKKILNGRNKVESGIYAVGKVVSLPHKKNKEEVWDKQYNINPKSSYLKSIYCIEIEITKNLIKSPILFKEIKNIKEIEEDKYLLRGLQKSVIPLSKKAFKKLNDIICGQNLQILKKQKIVVFLNDFSDYFKSKTININNFKIEKPNQNWVNITLLPIFKNKGTHIVLRVLSDKIKIEYYIDNNKNFFKFLKLKQNEIDSNNRYIWESYENYKCSKIYKEATIKCFKNKEEVYDWCLEEITNIYNLFSYYLKEFLKKEQTLKIYEEGKRKRQYIEKIRRNSLARQQCIEMKGVTCEVCGMNFEEKYGKLGKNYIEVHHIKPISEIPSEYKINPKEDLIPVCSNCHSMLHRKINGKNISVEDLKNIVKKYKY